MDERHLRGLIDRVKEEGRLIGALAGFAVLLQKLVV